MKDGKSAPPAAITRREFLTLCLAVGLSLMGCTPSMEEVAEEPRPKGEDTPGPEPEPEPGPEPEAEPFTTGGLPERHLGQNRPLVGVLGLGGAFAVSRPDSEGETDDLINRAIDAGVNYIDTAPTYGSSETNIGRVMRYRRDEVFLATKTLDRTYDGTMRLFERSLERLQTGHIDLYQLHAIHSYSELDQVLAPGGALEALEQLQEEGLLRYTGITGHKKPDVLLEGISRYDFDCILLSLNAGDPYYQPLQGDLLETAVRKGMGIIAMKVAAYGRIFRDDGITSMKEALGYVLSFPVSTAVVGVSSINELEENLSVARDFEPYSKEELDRLENLVKPYWKEANFFKTQW